MGYQQEEPPQPPPENTCNGYRKSCPRSLCLLISPKSVSQSAIHVDISRLHNARVETAGDSWLDSPLLPASSTRWLAVSKPATLMSEAREHSWIFRFRREKGNLEGFWGGNYLWTRRQSQLELLGEFLMLSQSIIIV